MSDSNTKKESGAIGKPAVPRTNTTTPTRRSSKVAGRYRDRIVNYYHFSDSDISHIKAANIIAAVFFGIGAWLLSNFVEFSKDITLAGETAPTLLSDVSDVFFVGWLLCWAIATIAMFWQSNEIHKIKMEHGDPGRLKKIKSWWNS